MSLWNRVQYPENKKVFSVFRDTSLLVCVIGIGSWCESTIVKTAIG